mmetsp:Transcript_1178/g.1791  ORF Transcript_1178/g.1791 Transcript_1178/m.1791 type:complete len:381 (+) Transcript_1178:81-1223(+)|eukprot:CAMPEP_0169209036 /NCGR_PEP_ID=MMETSP1016-20121227/14453_1 /TAXON_ID=342587 /ORGANISM="Karlodinium micrum, Strain CCMP2283" /LENGTH=380 /DNA_ID=CAMNT_0009286455 /DNA_START=79 /DNA_END=1221 /DNA_ORIENTATION=+
MTDGPKDGTEQEPPLSKHRRLESSSDGPSIDVACMRTESALVSVIIPCHNGSPWLRECLMSVAGQSHEPLEVSFWDDASTDDSSIVLESSRQALEEKKVLITTGRNSSGCPAGCGAAKNRAVLQSRGRYLCFLDADDIMHPSRVARQLELVLKKGDQCLIGSNVVREPADAQPRYTAWLNSLSDEQLLLHRFKECTLAMPTWFCARALFDKVGGFDETGPGSPEDLKFFYQHLSAGGSLAKVQAPLVTYRYHEKQSSRGVSADKIWALRVQDFEATLVNTLTTFSIWSAGRDGKRLYRSLSLPNRKKVVAFLDIDEKKMSGGGYFDKELKRHVAILDWRNASDEKNQPTVICVKSGLHEGFDENLASLGLEEGIQYWHFN